MKAFPRIGERREMKAFPRIGERREMKAFPRIGERREMKAFPRIGERREMKEEDLYALLRIDGRETKGKDFYAVLETERRKMIEEDFYAVLGIERRGVDVSERDLRKGFFDRLLDLENNKVGRTPADFPAVAREYCKIEFALNFLGDERVKKIYDEIWNRRISRLERILQFKSKHQKIQDLVAQDQDLRRELEKIETRRADRLADRLAQRRRWAQRREEEMEAQRREEEMRAKRRARRRRRTQKEEMRQADERERLIEEMQEAEAKSS